jgi:histidinol dehydrogenase
MKIIQQPSKKDWKNFTERPQLDQSALEKVVQSIFDVVQEKGDQALLDYAKQFDQTSLNNLVVSEQEITFATKVVTAELKEAIAIAKSNIELFHKAQMMTSPKIETTKGIYCWQKNSGIEKVGLYIPGGSAPLFSTILMLGIPAQLAGCQEIILCTPPNPSGTVNPVILYTADLLGIKKIFKVGGAQAIAAMAFGTQSIPNVYKIFGPGNQYVTKAKEMIQQSGIAIDMPAGPSEVLVIADESSNPSFVAADLLSQAEHGADSQVILLSNNAITLQNTISALKKQLEQLPRKAIAIKAIQNSLAITFNTLEECIAFSNQYAPEHLIIASDEADQLAPSIINAGSVFLGHYSCESAGDYASGTNHTLPTNGYARSYSGVTVSSFQKTITFQKLTALGLQNLGPSIEKMALAEELFAHKNAVSIRLKSLL